MPDRDTQKTGGIDRRTLLKGVTGATILGTVPSDATAVDRPTSDEFARLLTQEQFRYQYAAKFVCGESEGRVVAPGRYLTTVNVHNPREDEVPIQWKATRSFEQPGGNVSQFRSSTLDGDGSFVITCEQVRDALDVGREFFEGFVVIRSPVLLDVAAVYSAGRETVQTLDVEQVAPQRLGEGEGQNRPDLVPVPDPEVWPPFCRRNDAGDLLVVVENRGGATAGPSTTQVAFRTTGVVERNTPSLDPGESVTLTFPIPDEQVSCFRPNCSFTITVDADDDVSESNERNNVVTGVCIG